MSEFKGFATPTTVIATPLSNGDYYIASVDGTYTNFGITESIEVDSCMVALQYNGSTWDKRLWGVKIDGILGPKTGSTAAERVTIFNSFIQSGKKIKIYEEWDFGGATIDFTGASDMEIEVEKGGMLKNVTLVCKDTWFVPKSFQIFDTVTFEGTPQAEYVTPEMFGAKQDDSEEPSYDSSPAFNECFAFAFMTSTNTVRFTNKRYGVGSRIWSKGCTLYGNNADLVAMSGCSGYVLVVSQETSPYNLPVEIGNVELDINKYDGELNIDKAEIGKLSIGDYISVATNELVDSTSGLSITKGEICKINDINVDGSISIEGTFYDSYSSEYDLKVYKWKTTKFTLVDGLRIIGRGFYEESSGFYAGVVVESEINNLTVDKCLVQGITSYVSYKLTYNNPKVTNSFGGNNGYGYAFLPQGGKHMRVNDYISENCRHNIDGANGSVGGRIWDLVYSGAMLTNNAYFGAAMIGNHDGTGSMYVHDSILRGPTRFVKNNVQWTQPGESDFGYGLYDVVSDAATEGNWNRRYLSLIENNKEPLFVGGELNSDYWKLTISDFGHYISQYAVGVYNTEDYVRKNNKTYISTIDSNSNDPESLNGWVEASDLDNITGINVRALCNEISIEQCKFYNLGTCIGIPRNSEKFVLKNCYAEDCRSFTDLFHYSNQLPNLIIDDIYLKNTGFGTLTGGNGAADTIEDVLIIKNIILDNASLISSGSAPLYDHILFENIVLKNNSRIISGVWWIDVDNIRGLEFKNLYFYDSIPIIGNFHLISRSGVQNPIFDNIKVDGLNYELSSEYLKSNSNISFIQQYFSGVSLNKLELINIKNIGSDYTSGNTYLYGNYSVKPYVGTFDALPSYDTVMSNKDNVDTDITSEFSLNKWYPIQNHTYADLRFYDQNSVLVENYDLNNWHSGDNYTKDTYSGTIGTSSLVLIAKNRVDINEIKISNSEINLAGTAFSIAKPKTIRLLSSLLNANPLFNETYITDYKDAVIIENYGDKDDLFPSNIRTYKTPEGFADSALNSLCYDFENNRFYRKTTELGTLTGWILQPKTNYTATAAPTVTNDESEGYGIGSEWFYNGVCYKLFDNTEGAAVWNALN